MWLLIHANLAIIVRSDSLQFDMNRQPVRNAPTTDPAATQAAAPSSLTVLKKSGSRQRYRFFAPLCGLLIALIVTEIVVRSIEHFSAAHPKRHDRPERFHYPENNRKWRDFSYTEEKPANTFRMIVLGDSFTAGTGVQFDDTFSKRLERLLNMGSGPLKAEVLNFGVPGYNTVQEEMLFKKAVVRQPDLALLEITLNDAEMQPFRVAFPNFDPSGEKLLRKPIFQWWRTAAFVAQRLINTESHRFYIKYHQSLFEEPESWKRFSSAIVAMRDVARANKIKFAAVVFPMFSYPIDEHYPFWSVHTKINGLLDDLGVDHLDLAKSFEGIPPARLQILPGADSHPNEIGHRIAADRIYAWLHRREIVPATLKPAIELHGQKNGGKPSHQEHVK